MAAQTAERQQELMASRTQAQTPEVVRHPPARGVYNELPELLSAVNELRHGQFNVCVPIIEPDVIPTMYSVAIRPVAIDARIDRDGKPLSADIYQDGRDKTKYGITRIGLDKFAAAANLSWHPAYCGRVDDGTEQWFRRYREVGVVLGLDGTPRYITAHKSIDLRAAKWGEKKNSYGKLVKFVSEGGKDAIGMTESALQEARKFIDEQCESKAMNRVLRKYAFIKGLYTKDELGKPFVILALVFTGHTDDPELRREVARAMADRAMGATSALFGPAPSAANHLIEDLGQRTPPPPVGVGLDPEDDDGDEVQAGCDAPPAGEGPTRFIAKVKQVTSTSGETNGRRWTLHTIEFDDGTKATTFSKTQAGVASDAYENDHPVAVAAKQGEYGLEVETIDFVKVD